MQLRLPLIYLVVILASILPVSRCIKKNLGTKSSASNTMPKIIKVAWSNLFADPERKDTLCKSNQPAAQGSLSEGEGALHDKLKMFPRKKPNLYKKLQIGFDESSYLFDFLDDLLQEKLSLNFKLAFEEVYSLELTPQEESYEDVYSLENLYKTIRETLKLTTRSTSTESYVHYIQKVNPRFDLSIYENSINLKQFNAAINRYNWATDSSINDPAKHYLDEFDFNGDGRLNPTEFIISELVMNKELLGLDTCKQCFRYFIRTAIDPVFLYLDCNNDGKVNAEEFIRALKNLKRSDPMQYNIYNCKIDGELYHSGSFNDFILKTGEAHKGYVNKEEFRWGILLGYWLRQSSETKIYSDNTVNLKAVRWGPDRKRDLKCEEAKLIMKK